jgi:hypothetical protein
MLDVTEVSMYIMYLSRCKEGRNPVTLPMSHLEFKVALCKALLQGWPLCNAIVNDILTERPSIHMPSHTIAKRTCVVCAVRTPHTYCYQCGFKFMCWKEGCYHCFMRVLHNVISQFLQVLHCSFNFIFRVFLYFFTFSVHV